MVVDVWLVELEDAEAAIEAEELRRPRLGPDDLDRIACFNHLQLRRQKRLSTIALRVLIATFTSSERIARMPFVRLPGGKPRLPGVPLSFSVSHTEGRALVAISSDASVGVDIERHRTLRMSPPRQAAIVEAASALAILPHALAVTPKGPLDREADTLAVDPVLSAWVRLEALAKFDGAGMARLLTAAGVLGRRLEALGQPAGVEPPSGRATPDWPGSFVAAGVAIQDLMMPADPSGARWYAALAASADDLQQQVVEVRSFPVEQEELTRLVP